MKIYNDSNDGKQAKIGDVIHVFESAVSGHLNNHRRIKKFSFSPIETGSYQSGSVLTNWTSSKPVQVLDIVDGMIIV